MAGKIITGLVILSIIISCRPRQELLAPVLPVPAEITIASFNIERFNEDKITNQQITRVLAAIISRYDIVAVQETGLFSGGTNIIPFFLSTLNATAPHLYKAVVGPRTGRGGELERGVFFYKSNLIAAGKSRLCYSVTNGYPTFARLPLACAFCCGEFDFVLCNVHTKPARALNEIMALTNIYTEINTFFGEKDVIIAGDLNADNADLYFDEAVDSGLRERSVYYWAIDDTMDTTVAPGAYTYDRIIFPFQYTGNDYAGRAQVYIFDELISELYPELHINPEQVSDHYPVSCNFYTGRDND